MLTGQKTKRTSPGWGQGRGELRIPLSSAYPPRMLPPHYFPELYPLWAWGTPPWPDFYAPKECMLPASIRPATPVLAQIVQSTPQKCPAHPISSLVCIASKDWGTREPELTLMPSVTGRVLLEVIQRGTGAHLISCCLDWHAPLRPLSAWVLPREGWVGIYSTLKPILLLLHI